MRILIAEDDPSLQARIEMTLKRALYLTQTSSNGEDTIYYGLEENFDAIILDLGLPIIDGMTILRQWREAGVHTPVLVLTARDTWRDKVEGLRAGADDYLGKPFASEELLARIEALIRRAKGHADATVRVGDVSIDPASRTVLYKGQEVIMTAMEFRVLLYLSINAGKVINHDELIQHVYSQDIDLSSNVIEVIVSRIRKKLRQDIIQTRRGHGYTVPNVS